MNKDQKRLYDAARYIAKKEKILLQCKKYQADNKQKIKTYQAQWRKNNAEKCRIYSRAHRNKDPEKARERQRTWVEHNRDRTREFYRRYAKKYPEKVGAKTAARRMREKIAMSGLTAEEMAKIKEIYRQRDLMTMLTGQQFHVDHKIALINGGTHHPDNLQILPAVENLKKGRCV